MIIWDFELSKNRLTLLLVILFALVGCSDQNSTPTSAKITPVEVLQEPLVTEVTAYPGPEKTGTSPGPTDSAPLALDVNPYPYPEPGNSSSNKPADPVQIKDELVATDPALVNLAAGTPAFVEFFAFW